MHQCRVSLTTVQWLLKPPAGVGRFLAFSFHMLMAGPLHARVAMFDRSVDLMVHVEHHQPTSMGRRVCPLSRSAEGRVVSVAVGVWGGQCHRVWPSSWLLPLRVQPLGTLACRGAVLAAVGWLRW